MDAFPENKGPGYMKKHDIRGSKRSWFILITVLIASLTTLILVEVYLEITNPVRILDLTKPTRVKRPELDWAFIHPFHAYIPKPGIFERAGKTVNKYGFISTPKMTSVAKADNVIRVVFLGGSSTAGTGKNLIDEETWPYQVWLGLKKRYPDLNIEMINGAVSGYTTFESYGRLWSQIRFFDPDMVIVYHGWNDMYYFDDASPKKIIHWRFQGGENWGDETVEIPPKLSLHPLDNFFGWSNLYGIYRLAISGDDPRNSQGELGGRVKEDHELADSYDGRGIDIYISNLKLIEELTTKAGGEFYIIKQGTLMSAELSKRERRRCLTWYHTFNYQTHLRAFNDMYGAIDKNFTAAQIIDATGMTGALELFLDHIHPSPKGCAWLAGKVLNGLEKHSKILQNN